MPAIRSLMWLIELLHLAYMPHYFTYVCYIWVELSLGHMKIGVIFQSLVIFQI